MVAGLAADLGEEDPVTGGEDEGTTLLPRVALDAALEVAAGERAGGVLEHTETEGGTLVAAQAGGGVGGEVGVGEQLEGKLALLLEAGGLCRAAIAHDGEVGASGLDLRVDVAQLHDLLAAEQSAVVADEDQYRGSLVPQATEAHGSTVDVEHVDVSKAFGGETVWRLTVAAHGHLLAR